MHHLRNRFNAILVVFLSIVALTAIGTPASAAIPTRVDVGLTILDTSTWQWKGSGSYSNGDGTYATFCVQLRIDRPGDDVTLSSRCVGTPPGSQNEFSAPPVGCYNKVGWSVYTRAIGMDPYGNIKGSRTSSRIPMSC